MLIEIDVNILKIILDKVIFIFYEVIIVLFEGEEFVVLYYWDIIVKIFGFLILREIKFFVVDENGEKIEIVGINKIDF